MRRFKPATEADVAGILELMRHYYAEDGYPFMEDEARANVMALIRNRHLGRIWVAQFDGRIAGYLAVTLGFSLEYGGRDAFIDELYVSKGVRGQGLGKEALEVAEAYCRDEKVRALHLEVEKHRSPAIQLYKKTGFEDHHRYLMTKRIASDQN